MVATGQVVTGGGAPHTHAWSEVTGEPDFALGTDLDAIEERVDALELSGSAPTWESISGKPSTFAPAAHTQGWDTITSKPSVFPPDSHTHAWADVTGEPDFALTSTVTALDTRVDALEVAPPAHTHAWADITGEPTFALASDLTSGLSGLDTRVDALEAEPAPVVWVQYWNGSAYVDAPTARIYIGGPGPSSPVNGDLHIPDA